MHVHLGMPFKQCFPTISFDPVVFSLSSLPSLICRIIELAVLWAVLGRCLLIRCLCQRRSLSLWPQMPFAGLGPIRWAHPMGRPPRARCHRGIPAAQRGPAATRLKDEEVRQLCQQTEADPCLFRMENEGLWGELSTVGGSSKASVCKYQPWL